VQDLPAPQEGALRRRLNTHVLILRPLAPEARAEIAQAAAARLGSKAEVSS